MGHSPLHKEKLKKNLMVMAIIVVFMLTVWAVTILKIKEYGVSAP